MPGPVQGPVREDREAMPEIPNGETGLSHENMQNPWQLSHRTLKASTCPEKQKSLSGRFVGKTSRRKTCRNRDLEGKRKASEWAKPHPEMGLAWAITSASVGLTGEITESCNLSPTSVAGMATEAIHMLDKTASGQNLAVQALLVQAVKSHVGHSFSEKEGNDSNPEKCIHPFPGRRRERGEVRREELHAENSELGPP